MHFLLTFALMATLTAAMVLVRIYWERIPPRVKTGLVVFAAAVFFIFALSYATKWGAASPRLNFAFGWALLAAWEILLLHFSLLRPRWLTGIAAVVMLFPLLSASVIFPLALVFSPLPATTTRLSDEIISVRTPWGTGTANTTGTDLILYYQPTWMPLLRRALRPARYYNGKCDANAAYAVLEPDHRHVTMVCPAAAYLPGDTAISITLPLALPKFHSNIKEATPSSK